jgi:hypothetical protein
MPSMRRIGVHCLSAALATSLATAAGASAAVRVTAPAAGTQLTGRVVLRAAAPRAASVTFSVRWADADNVQRWHQVGRDNDPRGGFAISWSASPVRNRSDVRVRVLALGARGDSLGTSRTVRVRGGRGQVLGVVQGPPGTNPGGATPSAADPGTPYHVRGTCGITACRVNLRRAPTTASAIAGSAAEGDTLGVVCQLRGQLVVTLGGISDLWDRLADGTYVSDLYMDTPGHGRPTASLAWC